MSAWSQTSTGRAFDFAAPVVEPEHLFTEIAHGLSTIGRFAGQVDGVYSVAQHSVLMAEAAEDETGDPELAAFCLLHDAHESLLGDITSPTKDAIAEEMALECGPHMARVFRSAVRRISDRIDLAVFSAAGLDPDRYLARKAAITAYDLRALLTERRDLMRRPPRAWAIDELGLKPLPMRRGKIRIWPSPVAAERFVATLERLCPDAARAAGRSCRQEA